LVLEQFMVRDVFAKSKLRSFLLTDRDRYSVRSSAILATAIVIGLISGCGGSQEGPPRFDIAGTVTHKGQPVPHGFIQFQPDSSKGNSGPAGSAMIANGKYDTATSGQGTIGGPHKVVVSGFDGNANLENELPFGNASFPDQVSELDLPKKAHKHDFKID